MPRCPLSAEIPQSLADSQVTVSSLHAAQRVSWPGPGWEGVQARLGYSLPAV